MKRTFFYSLALLQSLLITVHAEETISLQLQQGGSTDGWRVVSFGKTRSNKLSAHSGGLKIAVDRSAGPVIRQFNEPKVLTGLRLTGSTDALIKLTNSIKQGDRNADDFVFRLGLVLQGDRKLSRIERRIAPQWIKELDGLSKGGIGGIQFYNVANAGSPGWQNRKHPAAKGLIEERVALQLTQPGKFVLDLKFPKPLAVSGLWIACDGDDTNSTFNVSVHDLKVYSKDGKCSQASLAGR